MRDLPRRLAIIASACALAITMGTGVVALTAPQALAASNTCYDEPNSQPTAAHLQPSASSQTVVYFHPGDTVYGPCTYWNNQGESHWYMQVNYNGGIVYIWVQRLNFGSNHECYYIPTGQFYEIGSSFCLLHDT